MIPILESLADVHPEAINWLWPERIASGRITLIGGDPGLGKSWLTLDLAARVSRGLPWPDGAECTAGNVLLMNCEDGLSDTIRPRLELLGADLANVYALVELEDDGGLHEGGRPIRFPVTLDAHGAIAEVMASLRPKLMVIDPISGYLGQGADGNRDTYVRGALRPIAEAAEEFGCAVVIVAHLNKSSEQTALYRFSGSVQFSGAARTAYYIGRDRSDYSRRIMLCTKNNIGRDHVALAYRIDPEHEEHPIQWEPEELSGDGLEYSITGQRESEDVTEIVGWLSRKVTSPRGISMSEIQKEARGAGWTLASVSRARRVLGMRVEQVAGEWYVVPAGADPVAGRGWKDVESI